MRDANLNIRILAERRNLPVELGTILAQTPQGGERVNCGTVMGVTVSGEDIGKNSSLANPYSHELGVYLIQSV